MKQYKLKYHVTDKMLVACGFEKGIETVGVDKGKRFLTRKVFDGDIYGGVNQVLIDCDNTICMNMGNSYKVSDCIQDLIDLGYVECVEDMK